MEIPNNIKSIVNKLIVQFATTLTAKEKRSIEQFRKDFAKNKQEKRISPDIITSFNKLGEIYLLKNRFSFNSDICRYIYDYLIDTEMNYLEFKGHTNTKLNLSLGQYENLKKFLQGKTNE